MTTTVVASEHVDCPPEEVEAYLEHFLYGLVASDGTLVLELRAPASALGLPGQLALEKRVVAKLTYDRDADELNRIVSLSWTPEGSGPFPSFSGTVVADAAVDTEGSVVSIAGRYAPPGGMAGDVFDALVGRRIARATIRELLERIRDGIEAAVLAAGGAKG
ncbi:MAG: hypothetical protein ACLPYS_07205 [Vulcanimicrobiaceae bacterium]